LLLAENLISIIIICPPTFYQTDFACLRVTCQKLVEILIVGVQVRLVQNGYTVKLVLENAQLALSHSGRGQGTGKPYLFISIFLMASVVRSFRAVEFLTITGVDVLAVVSESG